LNPTTNGESIGSRALCRIKLSDTAGKSVALPRINALAVEINGFVIGAVNFSRLPVNIWRFLNSSK
jgi:hypothetical protein